MTPTTFNRLLRDHSIDPREVTLLRHSVAASAVFARSPGDFERYQSTQEAGRPIFRNPRYWASFVAPTPMQTMFVGLYEAMLDPQTHVDWNDPVTGRPVGADKPGKPYEYFATQRSPVLSEYSGRLFVDWNRSERAWSQGAATHDKHMVAPFPTEPLGGSDHPLPPLALARATSAAASVEIRLGQDQFRRDLMSYWGGRCALTGLSLPGLLRASHIKPWRIANDAERLDPANGLLLAVHVDALFDAFLLSFADDGSVVRAPDLSACDLRALGIGDGARISRLHPRTLPYLRHHRLRTTRERRD